MSQVEGESVSRAESRISQEPKGPGTRRSRAQKAKDSLTFPLRAIALCGGRDRWGLSTLETERLDYVAQYVSGHCLDVGCGRENRFITEFLNEDGEGIDVYPYEGLTDANIVGDMSTFPFPDSHFDFVTFIACLNHVPRSKRDAELAEAYRCLRPGGSIILTMGNPLAEIIVHKLVELYDRLLGTDYDLDNIRGMDDEEDLYLVDSEIVERLLRAGFTAIDKKHFLTQWGLNHLFLAAKG